MSEGPGLTCLYKDGRSQNFEASDVEQKMADGWADSPVMDASPVPVPEIPTAPVPDQQTETPE